MLLLTNGDKLQLVTSSAATVDVHASFMDHTTSTDDVVGSRQNTAISSATTTDIVATPSSGVVRNIKTLHIRNKHASTSVDVTVVYDQSATDFQLHSATLRAGETLEYIEGVGFFSITAPTNPVLRAYALTSDHGTTSITPDEVSNLSVLTGTGVFMFQYNLIFQGGTTATGARFSVNHDGTLTSMVYNVRWVAPASAASSDTASQAYVTALGGVVSAYTARAKTVAGTGAILAVDVATADVLVTIEGTLICTVDGNIELWHGVDVAALTSTLKAGSTLSLIRAGD